MEAPEQIKKKRGRPKKLNTDINFSARTFFNVYHTKTLINLGIINDETYWDKIDKADDKEKDILLNTLANDFNDTMLAQNPNVKHYFTICKSEKERYHIHDVATYPDPVKKTKVIKECHGAHIEIMKGTKEQAQDYINKIGKYEEKGELILKTYGDPTQIVNNQGNRSDLSQFNQLIKDNDNFDFDKYIIDNNISEKYAKQLEAHFSRYIKVKNRGNERKIVIFYVNGLPRSGKTSLAVKLAKALNLSFFKANMNDKNNFPLNGYHGEKILILDELRPGIFNVSDILQILDIYDYNVNVKNGLFPACWEIIFITSCFDLSEWYKPGIKYDRDDLQKQFIERIHYKITVRDKKWYLTDYPNFTRNLNLKDIEYMIKKQKDKYNNINEWLLNDEDNNDFSNVDIKDLPEQFK